MDLKNYKQIDNSEYYVDKDGNIVSIKIRKLNGSITEDGYKQYHISNKGVDKYIMGHIAVAKAYIPNPENYPIVNHKDGNKLNNNIDNLEWCDYQYNSLHSVYILGNKPPITNEKPVICIDTLNDNKQIKFQSLSDCARYYGVHYSTIKNKIIGRLKNPTNRNTKLKGLYFKFDDSVEGQTTIP